MATVPNNLKLVYFDYKVMVEPTRLALYMGGIPFEDERLSRDEFHKRKDEFPSHQLPIMLMNNDPACTLTQSNAIARLAGRLSGLYPMKDIMKCCKVDEIMSMCDELIMQIHQLHCHHDREHRETLIKLFADSVLPRWLSNMERVLGKNARRDRVVGDKMTLADLYIYMMVDFLRSGQLENVPVDAIEKCSHLMRYWKAVDADDRVKQWNRDHLAQH